MQPISSTPCFQGVERGCIGNEWGNSSDSWSNFLELDYCLKLGTVINYIFLIQHPSTKLRKKLQELVEYAKSSGNMLNNNKNWENMLKKLTYICDVTNNISYFEFIGKMFKRRKVFIVLPFSCRPIFLVDYIFQFQENCLLCYRIIEQIECKKILVVESSKHYYTANIYLFKVSHRKKYKNVQNVIEVNNKDTSTTSMTSFWCRYC